MVEKVGLDNFFHHFYDSKDFLRNSWKKWKKLSWPTFFHDLGLKHGLSRGKSWPGQLFPLFPRISEEILFFTKMVEKLAWTTFSTISMIPKTSSEIRGKSGKSRPGQLLPFGSPKRLESWKKVGQDNFFHFFHEFLRKVYFSRKWWKKLAWTTFSTISMIPKTSTEIRGKSGKSCPGQLFPRFGPQKRVESWKKLARTTFSTFSTNF